MSMSRTYRYERTIMWGDTDPAGTMFSVSAFALGIEAMEAFYRDVVGITFRDLQEVRGLGAPMVHASCDYVDYAWLSDRLCLDVAIERLGKSSIAWKIDASKLPANNPSFHLKLVSASISLATRRATALPADFRDAMTPYVLDG